MDTCYVDTETTSLRAPYLPKGRRTWEAALVRVPAGGGRPLAAWLQITDVDLTHADPQSLAIGRFDERFVPGCPADCPDAIHAAGYGPLGAEVRRPWDEYRPVQLWGTTEANAAQTIDELTAGAVLASSNPGFDADNFADILRRHGRLDDGDPRWYHHHRDVPNVATGWLRATYDWKAKYGEHDRGDGWVGASYSTRAISEAVGVPEPADRHSAWADVLWMMDIDAAIGGPSKGLRLDSIATVGA